MKVATREDADLPDGAADDDDAPAAVAPFREFPSSDSSDSDSDPTSEDVAPVSRPRRSDAFDVVAHGVGTALRGVWNASLVGPLFARYVLLVDEDEDDGDDDDDDDSEGSKITHADGAHRSILLAKSKRAAREATAAAFMRSSFSYLGAAVTTPTRYVADSIASVSPFAKKKRKSLKGDDVYVDREGNAREVASSARNRLSSGGGMRGGGGAARRVPEKFTTMRKRALLSADRDREGLATIRSQLTNLREELRREAREEEKARAEEEAKAEKSAARQLQRAWVASREYATRLGRDLMHKTEYRAPERGAGLIQVRVRHLKSLLGTFLAVNVTRGVDLLPMDTGGTSDPYVNVWLEDEERQKIPSSACQRSIGYRERTLNPEWNEVIFLGDAELKLERCTLKFQVMDYDFVGADDEMGEAEIPLKIFAKDRKSALGGSPHAKGSSSASSPISTPQRSTLASTTNDAQNDAAAGEGVDSPPPSQRMNSTPTTTAGDGESWAARRGNHRRSGSAGLGMVFGKAREKRVDLAQTLRDFLAEGMTRQPPEHDFLELTGGRQIGGYTWIVEGSWAHAELMLSEPDQSHKLRQEAMAMLACATHALDPRNLLKSLSSTSAGSWLSNKMEAAVVSGKRKALGKFDEVVDQQRLALVGKVVSDRDMPKFFKKYIGAAVNIYASDWQRELMDAVTRQLGMHTAGAGRRMKKSRRARGLSKRGTTCWSRLYGGVQRVRAYVLYVEHPYDKTIFGKVRTPMWWVFLACKLYPGWGVQSILFLLKLCMIDRSDEWQLFEYIVQFKGIQFLAGVFSILSGVLKYIYCAGLVDKGEAHTCYSHGPGVDGESACSTLSFVPCVSLYLFSAVSRILLSWFAFYLMRTSFAFGKAIVGEHRIVGAKIEVHEIIPGPSRGWTFFGRYWNAMKKCCAPMSRKERARRNAPLSRFRAAVEQVMSTNRAAKGIQQRSRDEDFAFGGKFHIVRRKAKITHYDEDAGLHTIVFKGDLTKEKHAVDLDKLIFSVTRLQHMNPRRFQTLLNVYDIVVFTMCTIITLRWSFEVEYDDGEGWKFFALVFWTQSFYALFAFPFILTVIPGVQKLICTAQQTGYDKSGHLRGSVKRTEFHEDRTKDPSPRSRVVKGCYPLFH